MDINTINKAYLYLKSYAYHENLNLFLKQRVAQFELERLDSALPDIANFIADDKWHESKIFLRWLKDIDYHLLPKSVERNEDLQQNAHNETNGLFISNVRDSPEYKVSKINYFINAPVEIHIIEMLWCLYAGPALEASMTKDCYGNRMHSSALSFAQEEDGNSGQEIFKRYIDQYNKWRDQAITAANELSEQGDDVALLSLDLKSYFYHVDLDFSKIITEIESFYVGNEQTKRTSVRLTKILEQIFKFYNSKIRRRVIKTHPKCIGKKGLPIGFASSSIISNWYLSAFDLSIGDDVRPVVVK